MLFDGVCNLCHGAVHWTLTHDRHARIRFASLQSQAGRAALNAAGHDGPLPDSVVFIDSNGVHTQVDAMIAAGRALGFPWNMGVLLLVLPPFLRNAIYRWIARNRYRWFGRKESCPMPKPEWTARFLDAGEEIDASVELQSEAPPSGPSFFTRWVYAYWWIYVLPFPLFLLPWTDSLSMEWMKLRNASISWFSDVFFSIPLTRFEGGSGDTTANYIEIALDASLAVVAAIGLGLAFQLSRRVRVEQFMAFSMVLFRFYLASTMLTYGLIKLFPLQMPAPMPDRLMQPIGETSPMGLVWTFIGASSGYQMFGGFVETIAGLLLIFRRTATLGALVTAGVMLNVAALNYFYDVPVKLFSTHLVLLAFFLVAATIPRLLGLLVFRLPTQAEQPFSWPSTIPWRVARIAALLLFAWGALAQPVYRNYERYQTMGPGAEPGVLQGVFQVHSFESLDESIQPWLRFGIGEYPGMGFGGLTCVFGDGSMARHGFSVDHDNAQLNLFSADRSSAQPFAFELDDDGSLRLTSIAVDGQAADPGIVIVAQRLDEHEFPLTSRGFRWINEYPDNR